MCLSSPLPGPALLLPVYLLTITGPKESGSFSHYSGALGRQLRSGPRAKPAFVSLSIPLIWGAVLLLALLVVAVVMFAVMARKKGR